MPSVGSFISLLRSYFTNFLQEFVQMSLKLPSDEMKTTEISAVFWPGGEPCDEGEHQRVVTR